MFLLGMVVNNVQAGGSGCGGHKNKTNGTDHSGGKSGENNSNTTTNTAASTTPVG